MWKLWNSGIVITNNKTFMKEVQDILLLDDSTLVNSSLRSLYGYQGLFKRLNYE